MNSYKVYDINQNSHANWVCLYEYLIFTVEFEAANDMTARNNPDDILQENTALVLNGTIKRVIKLLYKANGN